MKYTASLSTSKTLKKAGFPQKTLYTWVEKNGKKTAWNQTELSDYASGGEVEICAAPIAEEVFDELHNIGMHKNDLEIGFDETIWYIKHKKKTGFMTEAMGLAEAAAKFYLQVFVERKLYQ